MDLNNTPGDLPDKLYKLLMVNCVADPTYAIIKRKLVRTMWEFAAREQDMIFNTYGAVALALWCPADAIEGTSP